jgi:hypothetical protein
MVEWIAEEISSRGFAVGTQIWKTMLIIEGCGAAKILQGDRGDVITHCDLLDHKAGKCQILRTVASYSWALQDHVL